MKRYSSVETVYKRNKDTNKIDPTVLRQDVHSVINSWVLTEKVDGTNIRVIYGDGKRDIRGRSDNANMHPLLIEAIERDTPTFEEVSDHFDLSEGRFVTLYGEGYGAGIQKNGGRYREDKGFIMFDVRITNELQGTDYFVSFDNVRGIAMQFTIPVVPIVGYVTTDEIPRTREELEKFIPYSLVAMGRTDKRVEAEGVVAKPRFELRDQYGSRVMWKLCYRDLA